MLLTGGGGGGRYVVLCAKRSTVGLLEIGL